MKTLWTFNIGTTRYLVQTTKNGEWISVNNMDTGQVWEIEGMYFNQWLDGFYPDRVYKIQLKLKTNDGQEQVFDDDFEFIVKRS